MARRFTTIYKALLPWWATSDDLDGGEGEGGRVVGSLMMLLDYSIERVRQGLEIRMPSRTNEGGARRLARDRQMIRGPGEPLEDFATRLATWRQTGQQRGTGHGLVRQVWHWAKNAITTHVRVVSQHGYAFDVDEPDLTVASPDVTADEAGSMSDVGPWDSLDSTHWARYWILMQDTVAEAHPDWGDPDLWGGDFGLGGYTIGQLGLSQDDVASLRELARVWGPGHARPEWVIVSLNGFDLSTFNPDYAHWSVPVDTGGGVMQQRRSRSDSARYWSLSPQINNVYAGNPARFPSSTEMVDGSTYDGDPTSFPASVTLPGGVAYAGDPTSFPTSVQLPDDGDAP